MSNEPKSQYCQKNEDPVFFKYLRDTGSLSKAMDLADEWVEAHGGVVAEACTNNYHEAELEKERLEYRIKVYNLNRDDFKESLDYYDELIESLKKKEEGKKKKFAKRHLLYKVNYFARNYEYTDLRYDDPKFFEKLDERQAKRLRTAFGKLIPDLDYDDPKVTVALTRRLWEKLKNRSISLDKLLDFLEEENPGIF